MIEADVPKADGAHRIRFGSETIHCHVRFGQRDRLRISVHPDQRVVVDAPASKPLEEVLKQVHKRGGWILKQRLFFEQFLPRLPDKHYVSGETFSYLGRQYRLKITESKPPAVKLVGRFLTVSTPSSKDNRKVRSLVDQWYSTHARDTFERCLNACLDVASRHGINRPQVTMRRMTRRWGSSSGNGRILLNTELVKAPVHCINYVIMHELCHQKYPNHSPAFFRLLSRCMPDWRDRKSRLEQVRM